MSRVNKWVIAATVLVITGLLICGASFAFLGFDINALSSVNYVTNTYDVNGDFQNINIKADRENVTFVESEDGKCRVECLEEEGRTHDVRVENDTLMIDEQKDKNHFVFGLVPKKPEITVYITKREYEGGITIETDTGNITLSDLKAEKMDLVSDTGNIVLSGTDIKVLKISTDTGNIPLKGVSCESLDIKTDTGNVILADVIVSDRMGVETDTGDVMLEGSDAGAMNIKTDTGNVMGTLLTGKIFEVKSSTGKISVPENGSGGRCEIKTATGNIKIELK